MIQLSAGTSPAPITSRRPLIATPPRRTARFEEEPGFYEPAGLWFYGNIRLLDTRLAYVERTLSSVDASFSELAKIEKESENLVLQGKTLVCGIHNRCHMRAAVVPLRWGNPRIVVFSGGFHFHLGKDLVEEPFLSATLWRNRWDAKTDLAVSRRAPDKLPTFSRYNPTVDRLILRITRRESLGIFSADIAA